MNIEKFKDWLYYEIHNDRINLSINEKNKIIKKLYELKDEQE